MLDILETLNIVCINNLLSNPAAEVSRFAPPAIAKEQGIVLMAHYFFSNF
jgi:hypothetical protein